MTLSVNEKRLIIATVSLVAGASTAKIYNCPDQTNITQCPLSLAMAAGAFLCSLMIGISRLCGARAHHLSTSLTDQATPLSEPDEEAPPIREITLARWRELDKSLKYIELPTRPQHPNYDTIPLQV